MRSGQGYEGLQGGMEYWRDEVRSKLLLLRASELFAENGMGSPECIKHEGRGGIAFSEGHMKHWKQIGRGETLGDEGQGFDEILGKRGFKMSEYSGTSVL